METLDTNTLATFICAAIFILCFAAALWAICTGKKSRDVSPHEFTKEYANEDEIEPKMEEHQPN